jgi:glycosyltransferase involved in cell wall biosynthesis
LKILVIYQSYLTKGAPGGSRYNEFARLWADAGHDVTVITGTLNYTTGEVPAVYRGKWWVRETDGKVKVWRCYVPATYHSSRLGRMWSFFGFTLSTTTAALLCPNADVVIATSPPLTIVIPGWVAARGRPWRRRCPLVFEIRDLWPESAVTTGVLSERSMLTRILWRLERWGIATADKVNVLTPAFRENLLRRRLATDDKIVFVPNGADLGLFTPGPRDNAVRREFRWADKFVMLYAGAHGRANALQQLVLAAEILKPRADILIATVGHGPERERLVDLAARRGLNNITFLGPQAKEQMPDFVNAADVGAAVLQNNPTFRTVWPNKVFDYMACARPTLVAIDGVARKLVCEDAKAGVYAEPENAPAIAAAIESLAADPEGRRRMGLAGREWVMANARRETLASRYLEILQELVGQKPGQETLRQ